MEILTIFVMLCAYLVGFIIAISPIILVGFLVGYVFMKMFSNIFMKKG